MTLGYSKRTANKEKRRELREQQTPEIEVLKDRKLIREEVNRRLVSSLQTANLEYDSLFNQEKASLNKDYDLLSLLFQRMFFYRLNEKLSGLTCDHTLRLSNQILTQMQFSRGKINDTIEVFKKNGGICDCEIIYNVESKLIGK
ncbi:DUF2695 domain-containing protein [Desulfosporosinus sp. BICA1-9]|uniref:DUF2695 domain-containing protein n=1 Tax=Desulfosporosinus sp. BICA1-9 TaxID=1531958 RepID=UPI00054C3A75|nr:DUF2695 domain-containing protein [Desulfosporosinus sp. BICA1-9]KJS46129.1 MAG: hypothetical protein VR66_27135 [Peptococcaceae bacterium BRH_c23]KJS83721.1 MAG: hypothetical protein JL57_22300 [Desulfosporosinus sp. BICA1-9]HBW33932.1 DUF2695 domain-containing protein [Desulfosporosinus sp.]